MGMLVLGANLAIRAGYFSSTKSGQNSQVVAPVKPDAKYPEDPKHPEPKPIALAPGQPAAIIADNHSVATLDDDARELAEFVKGRLALMLVEK